MENIYLQTIELNKSHPYYITQSDDAYRLVSGEVAVFFIPYDDPHNNKELKLTNVSEEGIVLPSLVIDNDHAHKSWRFRFNAVGGDVLLEVIPYGTTKKLQRRFLFDIGTTPAENMSFEQCLSDRYAAWLAAGAAAGDRNKHAEDFAGKEGIGILTGAEVDNGNMGGGSSLYQALRHLNKYAGVPMRSFTAGGTIDISSKSLTDLSEKLGFSCREIVLEDKWYVGDCGPLIAYFDEAHPVACYAKGTRYYFFDPQSHEVSPLSQEIAAQLLPRATSIAPSFPDKAMSFKELLGFSINLLSRYDLAWVAILTLIGTLISILLPTLNQKIYDEFIPMGSTALVFQLCSVIFSFMVGNVLFSVVKNLFAFRTSSRLAIQLQNATYEKIFHLPSNFFRGFESADLAARAMSIGPISSTFTQTVLTTILGTVFSVVYLARMFKYSSKLAWVALLMLMLYTLLSYWFSAKSMRFDREIEKESNAANSILYQFICGIEKIRIAGAENQTINRYLTPYVKAERLSLSKGRWDTVFAVLSDSVTTIYSIVLYYLMIKKQWGISVGSFIAFNTAFGMLSSAMQTFVQGYTTVRALKPLYERYEPIAVAIPEVLEDATIPPKDMRGQIEIRDLCFGYDPSKPVLKHFSLKIPAGQYIGIVGASGCGKSTLMRLLLGFEAPQSGTILYDGQDLAKTNKQALRRKFGVVLQNGDLISGSIFDNITITNPKATVKDVQKIVKSVGLEDDVKEMPMGLQTVLNEDGGTISGGQKQRILIARALINNPAVLFLDEATSALDNITQAQVCQTISSLTQCTRIVIAHRLSTIKNCDRIILMDNGRIAEDGNYASLMAQKGLFYQLASRQMVEESEEVGQ